MKDNMMNDYVRQMQAIGNDEASRARIETAIAMERARNEQAATRSAASRVRERPRRMKRVAVRAAAVAACCIALAVGATIATSNALRSDDGSGNSPVASSNTFALVAYANGEDLGNGKVALTPDSLISPGMSWDIGESYASDGSWDGTSWRIHAEIGINLTCSGNNISTITYAIDGDTAFRRTTSPVPGERPVEEQLGTSFSVNGDTQMKEGEHPFYYLELYTPYSDELYALQDQSDADSDAQDDYTRCIQRTAADAFAQRTLTVTATFTDGSATTHTYRIVPVDDFEGAVARNDERWDSGGPWEPIFTIEQLS